MYANTGNYDPLPRKALGLGLYSTLLAVDTLLALVAVLLPYVLRDRW